MGFQYGRTRSNIKCCRDCKPPKRCIGCHATCEDYIKEKKESLQKYMAQKEAAIEYHILKKQDVKRSISKKKHFNSHYK